MAKIMIKNSPRDINQLAKLLTDIATQQVDIADNGVVDGRELKSKKHKKRKK